MRRLAIVIALAMAGTSSASADATRAWEVARTHVPASTTFVVGVNVDAAIASSLSIFANPLLVTMKVKPVFEKMQSTCKLDPTKLVDGVVIVEGAKAGEGAYYLSLDQRDGLDERVVSACFAKLGLDGKVAMAWIGSDVLVIPAEPADTAMLAAFTSGATGKTAFANSALAKLVAKTDTRSMIWAASVKSRSVQGKKMKHGYGALDVANGLVTATIAMTFSSSAEAMFVEKLANDQIIALLASGQLDAIVMEMLGKVRITRKAAELAIAGSVPDKELLPLIQAMASP